MSPVSPSVQKDEVLESSAGFLWLAVLSFVPAALILFGLAAQIGSLIPFGVAALVNLVLLRLDNWRPTYPFRILREEIPPESLTDEQRRVLTYLQSVEARRSKRRLCGAMLLLTALVVGTPPFLSRVPNWVSHYLFIRSQHALNDSVFFFLPFLVFQGLATYSALFGWGCRSALRQWNEIQARYEPWPLARLEKAFHIIHKPVFTGEGGSFPGASRPARPRVPLSPNTPVSGRQVLGVFCFMLGGPALFVGGTSLARALVRGGLSPGSGVGLDLGLVVAGLALLWLGGYLWRR
jgi:hypothetical protein